MNGDEDGAQEQYGCSASYFEHTRQRMTVSEPMRIDNADRKWGPQQAYLDSLVRQARAADNLALLSPAGIFRMVATAVCGTDHQAQRKRLDDVRRYREAFIAYFEGKKIFEKFEYFTPVLPASFRTADQLVEARTGGKFKSLAEYDAWGATQTDIRARFQILRTVNVPGRAARRFPLPQDHRHAPIPRASGFGGGEAGRLGSAARAARLRMPAALCPGLCGLHPL